MFGLRSSSSVHKIEPKVRIVRSSEFSGSFQHYSRRLLKSNALQRLLFARITGVLDLKSRQNSLKNAKAAVIS